ncbi:MAG: hypothetical protein AAGJ31_08055 [Verrucomicrobiota bacterium]
MKGSLLFFSFLLLLTPSYGEVEIAPPKPLKAVRAQAIGLEPQKDFLQDVETAVELHDWLALLDLTEPTYRETQTSLMGHAQFIAELLGLNFQGNSLLPDGGDRMKSEHLSRIRQVEWKRPSPGTSDGVQGMLGTVILDDGTTLLIEVQFQEEGDRLLLTGAVG